MSSFNYKRRYYRIKLNDDLRAVMSINKVGGREVKSGRTLVVIDNISLSGLKFLSHLSFPVSMDIVMNFLLCIDEVCVSINGHIIYKTTTGDRHFAYGVYFDQIEGDLFSLLLKLDRKKPIVLYNRFS